MKKTASALVLLTGLGLAALWATTPQKWSFRSYSDFLRGRFDGVSLTAEGVLSLAPREEKIEGPTEEFYLSFLTALDGSVYVGTGHGGRVFRIGKDGKGEMYFQTQEMDVTCLAMDSKGALFAGTSPHGKIYKVTSKGQGAPFFDPAERYIWDLMFDGSGSLLAAVGENGGIYEITTQGQGRLIFKADENHILCLRRDRNGNIIAGSGGGGSVYRIAPGGRAQVLYETPFEEVRSLALTADGDILAAAGGTARTRKEEVSAPSGSGAGEVTVSISAAAAPPGQAAASSAPVAAPASSRTVGGPAASAKEPGALFKIDPDGTAKKLWSSTDEMIYALNWNETEKRLLFGTGPNGRLYALDREEKLSLVLQKSSEQIYALAPAESRLYLLANNPPQITAVYPDQRAAGEFLGPVLDAKTLASWGRLSWETSLPQGATVQILSRSGNTSEPSPAWSEWSPPYQKAAGEPVLNPKGRYLQFKVLFKTTSGRVSPALSQLSVFYLQTNEPPVLTKLELFAPNEVLLKPIEQDEVIWGLERRASEAGPAKKDDLKIILAKRVERRGYQTVFWEAEDENGDALSFSVWIKAEADKDWRLLEDRWSESLYTFASTNLADGVYTLKVKASDLPSNPPGMEKTGEKISPAFVIDNTPPVFKSVQVVKAAGALTADFAVEDQFSAIREVRYLLRPDDWRVAFPEDGICDGKTESFKLKIPLPAGADNVLTILVRDAAGNTAVIKPAF